MAAPSSHLLHIHINKRRMDCCKCSGANVRNRQLIRPRPELGPVNCAFWLIYNS